MTTDYVKDEHNRKISTQYYNCVSLGWFCGTASSLSKLGLRSHSGPFDWYFSCFEGVIAQIKGRFTDFMIKSNLEIVKDDVKSFRDTKYDFYCNHDIVNDFDEEYPAIYEKYMRRANVFMDMINHPTVFFRCIRDDDEVKYINNNWERIDNLLKSFNPKNQIVYICNSEIKGITNKIKVFDLQIEKYIGETYEMRHMFDNCTELVKFSKSLISPEQLLNNRDFDRSTNAQTAAVSYVNKCIDERLDGIDKCILKALDSIPEDGLFLWGAGSNGITLAKYLCDRNVTIRGIIDNKKIDEMYDSFTFFTPKEIPVGAKIFIAVADKNATSSIMNQIIKMNINARVVRYEDLYEEDLKH